jgi:sugar lactone lactonase YvrE
LPTGATEVLDPITGVRLGIKFGPTFSGGTLSFIGHNDAYNLSSEVSSIYVGLYGAIPLNITGPSIISCNAQTQTYSIPIVPNATSYHWTLPTGATGVSNSNSINVTFGATSINGNISVAVSVSPCGIVSGASILVQNIPTSPAIIQNGNILHCNTLYNSYQWYNQSGIINGATSQNYTPTIAGNYYCKASYFSNCISNNSNTISFNPQLPNIYYANPPDLIVGNSTTITPDYVNSVSGVAYGQVSTFAGSGIIGSSDGTGSLASFNNPQGIAIDTDGAIYVADTDNNKIRKITQSGIVSTFAGNGTIGLVNGIGSIAKFNKPQRLAIDASHNIYVSDTGNNKIRRITSNQNVTTFASLLNPVGISVDNTGNIFSVTNTYNKVYKITSTGTVTTFAGSGSLGFQDGNGISASFWNPTAIAIDNTNTFYVTDTGNNTIRQINQNADVVSYAGVTSLYGFYQSGSNSTNGYYYMNSPNGITISSDGTLYFSQSHNLYKFKTNPTTNLERVNFIAGGGGIGNNEGIGALANFKFPKGLAVDLSNGYLYVADSGNNKIRRVSLFGYSISPNLPAGLSFDYTTGSISGTPTTTFPDTTYTITAYNQYGSSNASILLKSSILGNSDYEKVSIKIYPNPTKDKFTIDFGNELIFNYTIKINNILGQEVYSIVIDKPQFEISNTWQGEGMYFVKILNEQNEVVNIKKIILQ